MSSDSARIAVLQVLRAIAALLVAQTHVIDVLLHRHARAAQATFGHFENFGAVGVDIFFVVSGFIVPLTALAPSATRKDFVLRRMVRIYPLWWCALLVWLIRVELHKHSCDWHLLARSALLIPALDPNYHPVVYLGWTLIFEMFFYSLIVLMWGKEPSTRLRRILMIVGALGLIGAVLRPRYPMAHVITNPILLEFCGGILIGIVWTTGRMLSRRKGFALLFVGAALLLITGYVGFGKMSEMEFIITGKLSATRVVLWGIPAALIVFGALSVAPRCNSRVGRTMIALGDASYSIYLTTFFMQLVLYKMWRFLGWLPGDLAVAAGVAIIAATGLGIYRCLELPILNRLKPITQRRARTLSVEPAKLAA